MKRIVERRSNIGRLNGEGHQERQIDPRIKEERYRIVAADPWVLHNVECRRHHQDPRQQQTGKIGNYQPAKRFQERSASQLCSVIVIGKGNIEQKKLGYHEGIVVKIQKLHRTDQQKQRRLSPGAEVLYSKKHQRNQNICTHEHVLADGKGACTGECIEK